ncbi:beta-lactamase family protein [Actinoallomurus spadix]|uniref:Serine hydrolase domain-containing protein n=1 Tax=Actinoallomurus spadix TaxID=79912 RepID=A0ABN0W9H5_9ACTN|nr:serine hydrolase domain-containing protein [Actinoallomurus spadix]MCO5989224.1 beta-lactamase family protein [Actinoallomurus spadix]
MRWRRGIVTEPVAASLMLAGLMAGPAAASDGGTAGCGAGLQVRRELDALTHEFGMAGAAAEGGGPACGRWSAASGLADVRTGRAMRADERIRIGSTTKTFTAAVVLQLVAERRIALDAPVDRYLPGLIDRNGYDGKKITVRGLLRHTSGLPDHVDALDWDHLERRRFRHFEPRELVALALGEPRPARRWTYSTTNYVVAGLIVEKVTGQPIGREITRRIIAPLGLRDTYWPGDGVRIRGPHPRGYQQVGDRRADFSDLNMSYGGAGGALVSSLRDQGRFFAALVGGRLLPRAELAEMRRTVAADPDRLWPGARYGLGLISTPLRCGGPAWGHGGTVPGYDTAGGTTSDGRWVQVVVNQNIDSEESFRTLHDAVETALCAESTNP